MRNVLIRILQVVVFLAVASSFAHADNFMYFKKKAAATGTTNYCNDASAELCLLMTTDGGDETDITANGYTLTVSASDNIPTLATVPTGYSGTSRDFESGDLEYLGCADATCPALDINGANAAISVVAWIKPESIVNAISYAVVGKYSSSGNNRQYQLTIAGTATSEYSISCSLSDNGVNSVAATSTITNYAPGTYQHIACVSNDTDIRIYVDGELASPPLEYTLGIANKAANFYIGATGGGTVNFDGLIDEVGVFSRELSSTEIGNIYTNGLTGNKGGSD